MHVCEQLIDGVYQGGLTNQEVRVVAACNRVLEYVLPQYLPNDHATATPPCHLPSTDP